MKLSIAVLFFSTALFLLVPGQGNAQNDGNNSDPVVFVPPVIGSPGSRVGAGSRLAPDENKTKILQLIAPRGGGLSASQSPRLYWWLKAPFDGTVNFVLQADGSGQPLVNNTNHLKGSVGLQYVDLSALQFQIRDGKVYQWTITLIPQNSSKKIMATSFVEFRSLEIEGIKVSQTMLTPQELAAKGYWYDIFTNLSVDTLPNTRQLKLLEQIGVFLEP